MNTVEKTSTARELTHWGRHLEDHGKTEHIHTSKWQRPLISTRSRLTQGRRQQDGSLEEGESNGPVRNDVCKRRRKAPSVVQAHQPREEEMGAGLKCRDLIYTIHILSLSQSRALHSAPEGINTICSGFSTLANS